MGFTAFKNNYISRVNGEGFATSADCADFIVSEYLGSFNIPTLCLIQRSRKQTAHFWTSHMKNIKYSYNNSNEYIFDAFYFF